jgi:hypothetical protein
VEAGAVDFKENCPFPLRFEKILAEVLAACKSAEGVRAENRPFPFRFRSTLLRVDGAAIAVVEAIAVDANRRRRAVDAAAAGVGPRR